MECHSLWRVSRQLPFLGAHYIPGPVSTSNDLRCFSQWPLKTGRAASSRPLTRKGDPATHLVGGKRGIQTQVGLVSKPWLLTAIVHCPSVPGTGKGVP